MRGRQPLTALVAPPLEDQSPGLGAHPNAKSMRLRATSVVWLKRSLHRVFLTIRLQSQIMEDTRDDRVRQGEPKEQSGGRSVRRRQAQPWLIDAVCESKALRSRTLLWLSLGAVPHMIEEVL